MVVDVLVILFFFVVVVHVLVVLDVLVGVISILSHDAVRIILIYLILSLFLYNRYLFKNTVYIIVY